MIRPGGRFQGFFQFFKQSFSAFDPQLCFPVKQSCQLYALSEEKDSK
jgi:hypothetical protein